MLPSKFLVPALFSVGLSPRIILAHGAKNSRHLVIDDLSMVALITEAQTTAGPFLEDTEADYNNDPDMTAWALDGSPGLTEDRTTVLNGVGLDLTIELYNINSDQTIGTEVPNAEIYLWHCDAIGVYSATDNVALNDVDTEGQRWLRSVQETDANGVVNFNTIFPGWYNGRATHIHIQIHLGNEEVVATSQLYLPDPEIDEIRNMAPYTSNTNRMTRKSTDFIYLTTDRDVRTFMTLKLEGSASNGYTSTIRLGLLPPSGFNLLELGSDIFGFILDLPRLLIAMFNFGFSLIINVLT